MQRYALSPAASFGREQLAIGTVHGMKTQVQGRISDRSAVIGVIGLGYVGLPLAHSFITADFPVIGFDVDGNKIEALKAGDAYLDHLDGAVFSDLATSGAFDATVEMERLNDCDVILVAVPTPLGVHHEPDLSYVEATAHHIGRSLRAGQLLVLESTTYPGTTRQDFLEGVLSHSADKGLRVGEDFFVAYSPEREDPGRAVATTSVPKLVGGLDDDSRDLAIEAYSSAFDKVIGVDNAEIAEAAKLLENIFRAVNIALVNEMKVVLDAMDIDIWKVVEAASTKPYGFMPFYPGPGLGGHCIPIDPFYLTWKAKEVGRPVQFIELAGLVNDRMPTYVVERLADALNKRGKAVSKSRVLVVGLAYKPDVGDTRESPSYEIIDMVRDRGGEVDYHDPYVPEAVPVRKHDLGLQSVELSAESLAAFDAVVIATAHSSVDYQLIADHSQLVIDTRNALADYATQLGDKLVKA